MQSIDEIAIKLTAKEIFIAAKDIDALDLPETSGVYCIKAIDSSGFTDPIEKTVYGSG